MYKSPIKIYMSQMQMEQEDNIYKLVQKHNITVNKDELVKALAYDRNQYDAGFVEGVIAFADYLKEQSFICDPGNGHSFYAIDVEEMAGYIKDFLEE